MTTESRRGKLVEWLKVNKMKRTTVRKKIILDGAYYESYEIIKEPVQSFEIALCRDTESPVSDYIFNYNTEHTDFTLMYWRALSALGSLPEGTNLLELYVNGPASYLVAVLGVCQKLGLAVDLYHFDEMMGDYVIQRVGMF